MKRVLGLAFAALILSGCAVVPLDGPYDGYGYRRDHGVRPHRRSVHPPAYAPHRFPHYRHRPYAYGPHEGRSHRPGW